MFLLDKESKKFDIEEGIKIFEAMCMALQTYEEEVGTAIED